MFVTVYWGDEFQSIASEEYISIDTPLQDLTKFFEGAMQVVISGDDFG